MKKQRVLFFIISVLLLSACNIRAKRATKYHDNMLRCVQVVIDSSLVFGDAVQSHQRARAMDVYENYSALVNKSVTKVQNAGDFDGDSTLLNYSLELLNFYKYTLERQFKPALKSIKGEQYNDAEAQIIDSLFDNLSVNENQYWDRFNWADKKFSKDNHLEKPEQK